jgi:hypothetical protein
MTLNELLGKHLNKTDRAAHNIEGNLPSIIYQFKLQNLE